MLRNVSYLLVIALFLFLVPLGFAGTVTLQPDLSSDPSEGNSNLWRTWGELRFENNTMYIDSGWDDEYSRNANPPFVYAGLFLNSSRQRDVREISADVKLLYEGDLTPADIGINITKITDENNQIQMRIFLNNSGGQQNGILTAAIFNHNRDTNIIETIAYEEVASNLSLDDFHSLRVSTDASGASMEYNNTQAYFSVDFGAYGQVVESDAYVWEWSPNMNGKMKAEVKNLVIEYDEIEQTSYQIGYWSIQHRKYEDGREFNRLYFEINDEDGNLVLEDIVSSVELIDPYNNTVTLDYSPQHFIELIMGGRYDADSGQWAYGSSFSDAAGYYSAFPGIPLESNEPYKLVVTDVNGTTFESYFKYDGLADLTIIPRSSIKYKVDRQRNLIASWLVPYSMDPTLDTSARAIVGIYQNKTQVGALYVRVPTHMSRLYVPRDIVELMQAEGDQFDLTIQLRTNDNNNRTYSKPRRLNRLKSRGNNKREDDDSDDD